MKDLETLIQQVILAWDAPVILSLDTANKARVTIQRPVARPFFEASCFQQALELALADRSFLFVTAEDILGLLKVRLPFFTWQILDATCVQAQGQCFRVVKPTGQAWMWAWRNLLPQESPFILLDMIDPFAQLWRLTDRRNLRLINMQTEDPDTAKLWDTLYRNL